MPDLPRSASDWRELEERAERARIDSLSLQAFANGLCLEGQGRRQALKATADATAPDIPVGESTEKR